MRTRGEGGFTLAELLISTVILAVIFAAITEGMIVGLRTTDSTDQRLRESVDAQIVSVYFGRDVQAAQQVTTGVVDTTCSSQVSVVSFSWPDPVNTASTKRASYVVGPPPVSGDERVLTRWYCDSSGTAQKQVARYLAGAGTPVTVTCSGSCAGSPSAVTMTLTDASGYQYSVSGTRRSS